MYFFFFLSFSNPLFSQEDGSDFRFLQIDVTRLLVLLVLLGIAHWIRGIQFEAESPATARHVNEAGHQRLVAIRWIIRDGILLIDSKTTGNVIPASPIKRASIWKVTCLLARLFLLEPFWADDWLTDSGNSLASDRTWP